MPFSREKRNDRPIERVLRYQRIQRYLKANKLRISPPYSATEWNYWHIYEDGIIKPITADELVQRCVQWEREHHVSPAEAAAAQHLYPMRPELQHEIERLKRILAAHGKEFVPGQGVPKARLQRTQQKLGIQLDPDLCAIYALTDGGPTDNGWFAVGIQNPMPVDFLCFDKSLKMRQTTLENEEGNRDYGNECDKNGHLRRGERIGKGLWFPPQWWAFGLDGWDTTVMLDYRPSPSGKVGQVIAFFHDPDELLCVADGFLDFFRKSNHFLEARWDSIFWADE